MLLLVGCTTTTTLLRNRLFDLFDSSINHGAILDLYKSHTTPFDMDMLSLGKVRRSRAVHASRIYTCVVTQISIFIL